MCAVHRRNDEILSVFLFYKMVQNGIPSFLYLPWNGSEQNFERFPFRETDRILTK
jgi:hypothetical protein